jgi:serine/threonine protein kinase
MPNNIFTTKIHEIILGGDSENFESVFVVMNLVDKDLNKLMSDTKNIFQEDHVLTVLYNLLCCLQYVHSANVFHRDIKPANILINNHCEVTICDFGMATTIGDSKDS